MKNNTNELIYGQFVTKDGNVSPNLKNVKIKNHSLFSSDSDIHLAGSVVSRKILSDSEIKKNKEKVEKRRRKRVAAINKNIKHSQKVAKRVEKLNAKNHKLAMKVAKIAAKKDAKIRQKAINSSVSKKGFSIGVKLISIISALVIISLGLITFLVSMFVSGDTRISAEDNNLTINSRTAADAENRLKSVMSNVGMFFDLIEGSDDDVELARNAALFFRRNQDVAAVMVPEENWLYTNKAFF